MNRRAYTVAARNALNAVKEAGQNLKMTPARQVSFRNAVIRELERIIETEEFPERIVEGAISQALHSMNTVVGS